MIYLQVFALIALTLWVDREGKRREREMRKKYDDAMTKLINTQLAFRMTLDELEKHYPEIYANDFYYMREPIGTDNEWFI